MADVVIYTRQFCGFCTAAKRLLSEKGACFTELDATLEPALRAEMVSKSGGACTFPQIFIDGRHVGGCDQLVALERQGKLGALLEGASAS
jgi:glutaredoxin 3